MKQKHRFLYAKALPYWLQKYKIKLTFQRKKPNVSAPERYALHFLRESPHQINGFLHIRRPHFLDISQIICNFAHVLYKFNHNSVVK